MSGYENDTHHCGAKPGQPHRFHDDVALCYWSGRQLIVCGHHPDDVRDDPEIREQYQNRDHDCAPSIWDGDYPGSKQAAKYGLYSMTSTFWGPPELTEDLNTLYGAGVWDVEAQQHIIPPERLEVLLLKQQKETLDRSDKV